VRGVFFFFSFFFFLSNLKRILFDSRKFFLLSRLSLSMRRPKIEHLSRLEFVPIFYTLPYRIGFAMKGL